MSEVRLSGRLICSTQDDADAVATYLPAHVELTRAEPGCLAFAVTPAEDPLVWDVEELFTDAGAFALHQQRVAASEWGRQTAAVERDYMVSGLPHVGPGGS